MSYVAFSYAEALFELALEENNIKQVRQSLTTFNDAIDEKITHFLRHPNVKKQQKKDVIKSVVKDRLTKHFLFVLTDNDRLNSLQDILKEFIQLIDQQNKLMKVTVYSNKKMLEKEKSRLETSLKKKHNREIELTNIIDKTIVGGLRIEFDGYVLDKTINHYLDTMKSELTK